MALDLSLFARTIEALEQENLKRQQVALELKFRRHSPQPIHVVYGGAQLFKESTLQNLPLKAREYFAQYVADAQSLRQLLGESWSEEESQKIYATVNRKLTERAIEDFRIDFEDGYGVRDDSDEDADAVRCAHIVANYHNQLAAQDEAIAVGFRVKPLGQGTYKRSLKTLFLILNSYAQSRQNRHDQRHQLMITLPKVESALQVALVQDILAAAEHEYGLPHGFFQMEALIENCEAFMSVLHGRSQLLEIVHAAKGRMAGLHFGVYDFNAALGIAPSCQDLHNDASSAAKFLMQLAVGNCENVGLSDGVINVIPVRRDGQSDSDFVDACRFNYLKMKKSVEAGFYQSWDIHPSQVWLRMTAMTEFVLRSLPDTIDRLITFHRAAQRAVKTGQVFDDRASVLGLVKFVKLAVASRIVKRDELVGRSETIMAWRDFEAMMSLI